MTTPRRDGFYMPAEFAAHSATIMIWCERPGSWTIPSHVARQTGARRKAISIFFFGRLPRIQKGRTVRHFQNVGHMTLCRTVQNGNIHTVFYNFQNARMQIARVKCNRFARFKINLQTAVFKAGRDKSAVR